MKTAQNSVRLGRQVGAKQNMPPHYYHTLAGRKPLAYGRPKNPLDSKQKTRLYSKAISTHAVARLEVT